MQYLLLLFSFVFVACTNARDSAKDLAPPPANEGEGEKVFFEAIDYIVFWGTIVSSSSILVWLIIGFAAAKIASFMPRSTPFILGSWWNIFTGLWACVVCLGAMSYMRSFLPIVGVILLVPFLLWRVWLRVEAIRDNK